MGKGPVIRPSTSPPPAACIDFGGVVARVSCGKREWLERLTARFPGFVTDDASSFAIDLVPKAELPVELERRDPNAPGAPLVLAASSYRATIDLAGRHAWVTGRPGPGTIVNLMRYLLPLLLPGGVAFHAGVLADRGRGFLMAGRSGCGKSSLARMLRERALGDEVGVVLAGPGGFTVRGSPHRVGRKGSAALAGIYLLARGAGRHERVRLDPAVALSRLSALAFWPTGHEREMRATLGTLAHVVEAVPVWELRFALRPDVWEVIAAPPEAA
jgi:hypothetical protein